MATPSPTPIHSYSTHAHTLGRATNHNPPNHLGYTESPGTGTGRAFS